MILDKDKIKESLTNEDIVTVLLELGSEEPHHDNQGRPKFTTVCHNGGGHNLQFYPEDQRFYCYSECRNSKDIFQLVIDAKATQGYEISFPDAVRIVSSLTGKEYTTDYFDNEQSTNNISDWDWLNKVTHRKPQFNKELKNYNENTLSVFIPYTNDWVNEGITPEVAELYEIGWSIRTDSIIIPHRDENGRLIGIRQRNTRKADIDSGRKYVPATTLDGTMYNHATAMSLYSLHITKESIQKAKRVYIFEGEKSCMKCQSYYGDDNFSVSVSGSNISNWQAEKILSLGVEHVIIAFDKFRKQSEMESDIAYERAIIAYQDRLLKLAHKFTPFARTYIIWDDEDVLNYSDAPIDKGKDEFERLTKSKIEITTKGE